MDLEKEKEKVEISLLAANGSALNRIPSDPTPEPEVLRAPDGGWGWIVCFSCFMVHVFSDGLMYSFGIIYIELLDYFNHTKGETAWIVSIAPIISNLFGPFISALCNKFGCRIVCIAGALLYGFGFIISAVAPNIYLLYLSLGVMTGFGNGMVYQTSIVSVTWYFEKKRALATGLGVCGAGIGTFIFGPVTKLLIDLYTWRGALLIEGALVLNCIACGLVYLPLDVYYKNMEIDVDRKSQAAQEMKLLTETNIDDVTLDGDEIYKQIKQDIAENEAESYDSLRVSKDNTYLKTDQPISNENVSKDKEGANTRKGSLECCGVDFSIFRSSVACMFMLHSFLLSMGYRVPYMYLPDRARDAGVTGYEGAWLISIIGITNTIGRVVFGFISDFKCVNRLYIYNSALIICGVGTALGPLLSTFELLILFSVVYGIFSGVLISLMTVVLTDIVGIDKLMDIFGFANFFGGLAYCIGPPGAGWLYDVTGDYNMSFIVCGALVAVSGAILFIIPCLKKG